MLVYFIVMLVAAGLVLANNRHHEANRWAAYFLASASVGGLSYVLIDMGWSELVPLLQFVNYTFTPYAVLVFCSLYTLPRLKQVTRRRLKLWLLLPVLFMALLALTSNDEQLFFVVLLLLFAPYYVLSCGLLIRAVWLENNRQQRWSKLITTAIIVPTLLGVLIFIYGAKVFEPDFDFFSYVSVFIAYSLVIAGLSVFMNGVLGVKLRFEPGSQDSKRKAVSTGATMLNHTIKNEMGKIALSAENIKSTMSHADDQTRAHLQIISNATRHMLGMVTRMHSQLKDFDLHEQEISLVQLIEQCLMQQQELFKRKLIKVRTMYDIEPTIIGDPVHLTEALGNVLQNASEAIALGNGQLHIRVEGYKRGVRLVIKDNGPGIPADLIEHVFEPFVSSGKAGSNFGLGLSYVYNVMQKSGGKVEIENRESGGTSVIFYWPQRKLTNPPKGGSV